MQKEENMMSSLISRAFDFSLVVAGLTGLFYIVGDKYAIGADLPVDNFILFLFNLSSYSTAEYWRNHFIYLLYGGVFLLLLAIARMLYLRLRAPY